MQRMIRSIFILFLLGFFTVASAQLPPKIMADKHLIHAEQLYAAKDYTEAFNVMGKVVALQKEHNLTLPDEFHFKYAQIALAADSTQIALESVTRYLSATGEGGEFYKEALALMLKAEGNYVMTAEDFYNEVIRTEGTCGGLPVGSSCWMELANHPGCYVWNDYLWYGETAIWTGKCSGHVPYGKGTLSWYYIHKDEDGKQTKRIGWENTGQFRKGKKHGQWIERDPDGGFYSSGTVYEGSYVDGKRHGQWIIRYFKSADEAPYAIEEGAFVEGEKYGKWITRHPSGSVREEEYSYVEGERVRHVVDRTPDGTVTMEFSYKDGKSHGRYFQLSSDGSIYLEGTYVEGKKHGHWFENDAFTIRRPRQIDRFGRPLCGG